MRSVFSAAAAALFSFRPPHTVHTLLLFDYHTLAAAPPRLLRPRSSLTAGRHVVYSHLFQLLQNKALQWLITIV